MNAKKSPEERLLSIDDIGQNFKKPFQCDQ
jgi:hypothetical protein